MISNMGYLTIVVFLPDQLDHVVLLVKGNSLKELNRSLSKGGQYRGSLPNATFGSGKKLH